MIDFVICGIEHSGTTLVSDLFRQIPHVDSGWETGVLLARTPRLFPAEMPYAEYIVDCWGITREEFLACCDTDAFAVFYARLAAASRAIDPGTRTIFDKTPRYLAFLPACMARADVPFIVTYKDPRSIVFSDYVRAGSPAFDGWFAAYLEPKLGYMRHVYAAYTSAEARSARVLRISLERLCLAPLQSCEAMFAHCGQAFSVRYLVFRNLRYAQTRASSISPRIPFEYMEIFSPPQIERITRAFSEFGDWFYD